MGDWKSSSAPRSASNYLGARKLYLAALIAVTVVCSVVAAVYYRSFRAALVAESAAKLELVANLKAEDLERWRRERLGDVQVLVRNPSFARLAERALSNPTDGAARQDLQAWLRLYLEAYKYDRGALLSGDGTEVVSEPPSGAPICREVSAEAAEIMRGGVPVIHDLHLSDAGGVRYTVVAPVVRPAGPGSRATSALLGIVALRGDPRNYLYPLIARWPTPSPTAETLLTRREGDRVVFLNDLKFRKGSALRHSLPMTHTLAPAVKAALGRRGIVLGRDYRDVPVLAYVLPVPDTNWYLTARMDLTEVYEPAGKMIGLLTSGVVLLSLAFGLALLTLWNRQRAASLSQELAAAKALQEGEQRYRTVLDSMAEGYQVIGFNERYLYLNAVAARQHGVPIEERVGKSLRECHPDVEATPAYEAVIACLTDRRASAVEVEVGQDSDERRHYRLSIQPVDEGALVLSVDVTAQREHEKDMAAHVARMEALSHLNALSESSETDILDFALEASKRMTGSPTAFLGWVREDESRLSMHRRSSDDRDGHCTADGFLRSAGDETVADPRLWAEAVRSRAPIMVNRYSDDGAKQEASRLPGPITRLLAVPAVQGGRVVAVVAALNKPEPYDARDTTALLMLVERLAEITARKRVRDALEASEQRFRTLADSMAEGVALHEIVKDEDGTPVDYTITYVNPAYSAHTGIAAERIVGRRASEAYGGSPPYLQEYARVAETGERHEFETFFEPLGRHFRVSAVSPEPGKFATVFEDITERKRREQELADRTREMERFTYAASHDLRSPLVTVTTFLGYLKEDLASGDTGSALGDMEYIEAAAAKMGKLLDELLRLSRVGRVISNPAVTSFRQIVDEALVAVAGAIAERHVAVNIQDGDIAMFGDVPRLVEVWQNLIENAVKFMGDQAAPRIEIGFTGTGKETTFFVRDNGVGIAPQHRSRVFGMFDKLDPRSPGTGMGLALVKRIVEVHDGTITVESGDAHGGASFVFTMPNAILMSPTSETRT